MIVIGLTGSIAMGKSATAKQFAARGVPVFDSDQVVHELYAKEGAAVPALMELVPSAVIDGAVDRNRLSQAVREQPDLLKKIEAIVHPMVRDRQKIFLANAQRTGATVAVLDIPLLFETAREQEVDRIAVVSTTAEIQRERALQRPGMTPEKLDFILSRQMADAEKRARADYVIDTSISIADSQRQVDDILLQLSRPSGS
ncbi:MAG: dephospho-CoA kinase [Hyphomicrobiales bacterium]|nr:dephospho-CoA kinase [Hyphomicrobiales bacterium]